MTSVELPGKGVLKVGLAVKQRATVRELLDNALKPSPIEPHGHSRTTAGELLAEACTWVLPSQSVFSPPFRRPR